MRRRQLRPSINEQLNIGVPRNVNIPSRYARGLSTIQPQLGSEDWSLDFYNDIDSLRNFSNRNQWDSDNYSNAGGYGLFCGRKCVAEKQAAGIPPKRSGRGGKHDAAFESAQQQAMPPPPPPTAGGGGSRGAGAVGGNGQGGMSTGAKIGIGVGAVVILGLVGYLIIRKK
jgi:hypothetical protein